MNPLNLDTLQYPIVQISLDLTDIDEALETAAVARGRGGLAGGGHAADPRRGPAAVGRCASASRVPIVADLKTMDGGYLEAEMMAKAGATHRGRHGAGARGDDQVRREGRPRLSASR